MDMCITSSCKYYIYMKTRTYDMTAFIPKKLLMSLTTL